MRHGVMIGLLLSAACGPSREDLVKKHGAQARQRLELLKRVLDNCRSRSALEMNDAPEALAGVTLADGDAPPIGNARSIWLDANDRLEQYLVPLNWSYSERDRWWRRTAEAMGPAPPSYAKNDLKRLKSAFEELEAVEYILVIKTVEYNKPTYDIGRSVAPYTLGSMVGEAHLYRLQDGTRIGGLKFRAQDRVIGSGIYDFTLTSDQPSVNLRSLEDRLYGEIHKAAQAHWGARVRGVRSPYPLPE